MAVCVYQNSVDCRQTAKSWLAVFPHIRKSSSLTLLFAAVLATLLGACAKSTAAPTPVDFKQSAQSEGVSKNTFDKSLAEVFTTKGKPTKTIETLLGPREIYDPTKDALVIAAFEDIFNEGNLAITTRYQDTTLMPQIKLLIQARESHTKQLAQYCGSSGDSSCTTFYYNRDYRIAGTNVVKAVSPTRRTAKKSKVIEVFELSNQYGVEGTKKVFSVLPEDIQVCSRKTLIINSDFKPIGERSGQPKNEQLNEFFETFCLAV